MELDADGLDQIRLLRTNKHFALYLKLLDAEFKKQFAKLRKCQRDKTFYKLQGFLDGIEWARDLVDNTISDNQNPGNGAVEEDGPNG